LICSILVRNYKKCSGTLDISIAEIKDKNLEVKAVGGDTQLGEMGQ